MYYLKIFTFHVHELPLEWKCAMGDFFKSVENPRNFIIVTLLNSGWTALFLINISGNDFVELGVPIDLGSFVEQSYTYGLWWEPIAPWGTLRNEISNYDIFVTDFCRFSTELAPRRELLVFITSHLHGPCSPYCKGSTLVNKDPLLCLTKVPSWRC